MNDLDLFIAAMTGETYELITDNERVTLISTKDAEAIYGIPERTIRRWHAEGRMTDPTRDGHKLMWVASEIDQMAQHREGRVRLRRVTLMTDTQG